MDSNKISNIDNSASTASSPESMASSLSDSTPEKKARKSFSSVDWLKDLSPLKKAEFILTILTAGLVAFYYMSSSSLDNDFYFLYATGKYIVSNGFPRYNPFFLFDDFRIVIQQWIPCLINYVLYEAGGRIALFIYSAGMFILFIYCLYRFILHFYPDKRRTAQLYSLLAGFLFYDRIATTRPYTLDMLLVIGVLYVLEEYHRNGDSRKLILLLPLSVAMMNVRMSTWIFMFAFILAYVFLEVPVFSSGYESNRIFRSGSRSDSRKDPILSHLSWDRRNVRILKYVPLAVLVGLLNPYGIKGLTYFFSSYRKNFSFIAEMRPAYFLNTAGYTIMFVLGTAILLAFLRLAKGKDVKVDSAHLYLLLGTAVMTMYATRCMIYLVICSSLLIMDLASPDRQVSKRKFLAPYANGLAGNAVSAIMVVVLCFSIVFFAASGVSSLTRETADNSMEHVDAVAYLEDAGKRDSRIFTTFNVGGFYEFNGFTSIYMDSRAELSVEGINRVRSTFDEYVTLYYEDHSNRDIEDFLSRYDFEYLDVYEGDCLDNYCGLSEDYELVVDGNGYNLYRSVS